MCLWEAAARLGWISSLFFASPSSIFWAGVEAVQTADFWNDCWVSAKEFGIGYLAGVAVGLPFGVLTGWFRRWQYLVDPWLNALNATPRIALLPLIVLWFGLGLASKVVVVFLGVFVSIAFNTFHGVRVVEQSLMAVPLSFGANQRKRVTSVVLPSVVPFALVGMRIGIGRGITGMIVGEYFTSRAGLGNFIFRAGERLQTDRLLFGSIVVTAFGLGAFWGIARLERRFRRWRPLVGSAR
jgi:NitT/TauT family transport system permease protein